jgi:thioredoxin-related protein/YHS domain-containing protein
MLNPAPRRIRVGLGALLAFGLLGSTLTDLATAADDARKINWREDLGQAQAEARSRDLLLWIQFTGPWCINCRRMDRATFVHPPVVTESRERFVPVKLRSDEHELLALSLGLSSLPSTVIVRPNGEVVDRFEGYIEPERFEATLTALLRREGRSAEQVAARAAEKKKLAARDSEIALAGYCPVSLLRERKLVQGRPELTVEHDGRVFRFADEATLGAFRRKPDAFAPANDGRCPVSQVDRGDFHTGDPRWGVVYAGHLFLFKDEAQRDRFVKDPERYANVDAADRGSCPHCWNRSITARRTPSRFSAVHPDQGVTLPVANRIAEMLAEAPTLRP